MSAGTGLPGVLTSRGTSRRIRSLFHFRAADALAAFLTSQTPVYTRAGVAGQTIGSDGYLIGHPYGAPRFEAYDADGDGIRDRLAVMIESAIGNSLSVPYNFSDAAWTKNNTTITDYTTYRSPFGGFIGVQQINETAATGQHNVEQAITITAGEYLMLACIFRPLYVGGRDRIQLVAIGGSDYFYGIFRADLGTVTTAVNGAATLSGYVFEPLGGGYYLCAIAGKVNAASTSATCRIGLINDSGADSYAGSVGSGPLAAAPIVMRCGTGGATFGSYVAGTTRTRDIFHTLAGAKTIFKQGDFTVYVKLPRPRWADWSGNLKTSPYVLRLGTANPQMSIAFNNGTRSWHFNISDAVPNFVSWNPNIPPGRVLEAAVQVKNWASLGQLAYDIGAGMSIFGSQLPAVVTDLGSDAITVGDAVTSGGGFELDGGIDTIKIVPGLRSLADMREIR